MHSIIDTQLPNKSSQAKNVPNTEKMGAASEQENVKCCIQLQQK
jgi:hypothetical protein